MSLAYGSGYSTPTLTISGKTLQTGNITWAAPTLPVGSTINSTTVTGTATGTFSNNGTITVGGTTVTSGVAFSISMGTTLASSVAVTGVGVNKNTTGSVTFSNISYAVDYTVPAVYHTLTIYYKDTSGNTLATTHSSQVAEGDPYNVSSPSVTGYTPDQSSISGTMGTSDVTVTVTYTLNPCTVSVTPDYAKINGSGLSTVSVSTNINAKAFEARATLDGQPYGRGIGTNVISDDVMVDSSGVHIFSAPTTSWSFDVAYTEINTDGEYRISVYAMNEDNVWSS